MKKQVEIDERAVEEIEQFDEEVQVRLTASLVVLARDGFLREPYAKRMDTELFEIRVKYKGQYRAIYAYLYKTKIIVLSAFQKKTQKTPKKEISKAKKRLRQYI